MQKKQGSELYMAYNHNGTPLLKKPATKSKAEAEVREYMHQTGNPGAFVAAVAKGK